MLKYLCSLYVKCYLVTNLRIKIVFFLLIVKENFEEDESFILRLSSNPMLRLTATSEGLKIGKSII